MCGVQHRWESKQDIFIHFDRQELSFAAGIAAFGMILHYSLHKGTADFNMAYELVGKGLDNDPHDYRAELQELITEAKRLSSKQRC